MDARSHNGDSIYIGPGTYAENLTINKSLVISGIKPKVVTLTGAASGAVVTAVDGVVAELEYVTIWGGSASSTEPAYVVGGVFNMGQLALYEVRVEGNTATVAQDNFTPTAGGILNVGTLGVYASTITGNSSVGGCITAGGLANYGSLFMDYSTVSGNWVTVGTECDAGPGGIIGDTDGFYSIGTAVVDTTLIEGNKISNNGALTLTRSTVSGAAGDGIDAYQPLTILNSTIAKNGGTGIRAVSGFYGYNGAATLSNVTVVNNGGLGVSSAPLTVSLRNSILSGNGGGACDNGVILEGYDIVQSLGACSVIDEGHNLMGFRRYWECCATTVGRRRRCCRWRGVRRLMGAIRQGVAMRPGRC
jgi:hypothetical protein